MSDQPNTQINLKETLNLPTTEFPIRAALQQKEPEILKNWSDQNLSEKIAQKSAQKTYILHDGPPYPNGDIHLGHALNKVLKDIINRFKTMNGHKTHFIPGWDCHGLPIETQVQKELKKTGQDAKKSDITWFRNQCKEFALKYVHSQKEEFIRLGIEADWQHPYLTLDKNYEAAVVELFGQIAENGLIYKGSKPIHWCMHCETALAEAEIDYADHRSPSIYVSFALQTASPTLQRLLEGAPDSPPSGTERSDRGGSRSEGDPRNKVSVLVWTTTPWTLPANVAVAAHPDFDYAIIESNGEFFILVSDLTEKLTEKLELKDAKVIGKIRGIDLKGTILRHPFLDRESPIVTANYVTKEDGTGFVHIAPGHGQEDHVVGREYNLEVRMSVDDKGKFTDKVGLKELEGVNVFDANKIIGQIMEQKGTLKKLEFIKHSYPHCWRCKNPVIFRATEQWFVVMDRYLNGTTSTLRELAFQGIKDTKWFPDWGAKRIRGMIESRPDWCVSRQRSWGIPIPVFTCTKCGNSEMTGEFNKAIVDLMRKEGATAWFEKSPEDILPWGTKCSNPECNGTIFTKDKNILDVWFESGSSFHSVVERPPADLYLEGSDQHRGWFQSSLLIGLAAQKHAPFKAILTHGFINDEDGKKMSKSLGNVTSPQSVIKEFGADVLRWWVAGADFKNADVTLSKNVLKQCQDAFGKVRNTIRFCLSNLYDFDAEKDAVPYEKMNEIDRWALLRLNHLIEKCRVSFDKFDFHVVTHAIHDFCAVDLSALYLDMVKDRLYCGQKNGPERRSSQTALYEIVGTLICLIAPILVFTSEDAYRYFPKKAKLQSVHLENLPTLKNEWANSELEQKWEKMLFVRDEVYKELEKLRAEKKIGTFLEAEVQITLRNHETVSKNEGGRLEKVAPSSAEANNFSDWAPFLIVSQVHIKEGPEEKIEVKKAEGGKCERCWKILPLKGNVCARCDAVIRA